jgi:hypothetical protein
VKKNERSRLLYSIANDLSVILWASELAQRDLDPESDTRAHLAHIRQRVHEARCPAEGYPGKRHRVRQAPRPEVRVDDLPAATC